MKIFDSHGFKQPKIANGRRNAFSERRKDQDLGCAQSCSAGVSVSPDRYYLIFHVKAFRIPERHLIHVSPFETRLGPPSNSSLVARASNASG